VSTVAPFVVVVVRVSSGEGGVGGRGGLLWANENKREQVRKELALEDESENVQDPEQK